MGRGSRRVVYGIGRNGAQRTDGRIMNRRRTGSGVPNTVYKTDKCLRLLGAQKDAEIEDEKKGIKLQLPWPWPCPRKEEEDADASSSKSKGGDGTQGEINNTCQYYAHSHWFAPLTNISCITLHTIVTLHLESVQIQNVQDAPLCL